MSSDSFLDMFSVRRWHVSLNHEHYKHLQEASDTQGSVSDQPKTCSDNISSKRFRGEKEEIMRKKLFKEVAALS